MNVILLVLWIPALGVAASPSELLMQYQLAMTSAVAKDPNFNRWPMVQLRVSDETEDNLLRLIREHSRRDRAQIISKMLELEAGVSGLLPVEFIVHAAIGDDQILRKVFIERVLKPQVAGFDGTQLSDAVCRAGMELAAWKTHPGFCVPLSNYLMFGPPRDMIASFPKLTDKSRLTWLDVPHAAANFYQNKDKQLTDQQAIATVLWGRMLTATPTFASDEDRRDIICQLVKWSWESHNYSIAYRQRSETIVSTLLAMDTEDLASMVDELVLYIRRNDFAPRERALMRRLVHRVDLEQQYFDSGRGYRYNSAESQIYLKLTGEMQVPADLVVREEALLRSRVEKVKAGAPVRLFQGVYGPGQAFTKLDRESQDLITGRLVQRLSEGAVGRRSLFQLALRELGIVAPQISDEHLDRIMDLWVRVAIGGESFGRQNGVRVSDGFDGFATHLSAQSAQHAFERVLEMVAREEGTGFASAVDTLVSLAKVVDEKGANSIALRLEEPLKLGTPAAVQLIDELAPKLSLEVSRTVSVILRQLRSGKASAVQRLQIAMAMGKLKSTDESLANELVFPDIEQLVAGSEGGRYPSTFSQMYGSFPNNQIPEPRIVPLAKRLSESDRLKLMERLRSGLQQAHGKVNGYDIGLLLFAKLSDTTPSGKATEDLQVILDGIRPGGRIDSVLHFADSRPEKEFAGIFLRVAKSFLQSGDKTSSDTLTRAAKQYETLAFGFRWQPDDTDSRNLANLADRVPKHETAQVFLDLLDVVDHQTDLNQMADEVAFTQVALRIPIPQQRRVGRKIREMLQKPLAYSLETCLLRCLSEMPDSSTEEEFERVLADQIDRLILESAATVRPASKLFVPGSCSRRFLVGDRLMILSDDAIQRLLMRLINGVKSKVDSETSLIAGDLVNDTASLCAQYRFALSDETIVELCRLIRNVLPKVDLKKYKFSKHVSEILTPDMRLPDGSWEWIQLDSEFDISNRRIPPEDFVVYKLLRVLSQQDADAAIDYYAERDLLGIPSGLSMRISSEKAETMVPRILEAWIENGDERSYYFSSSIFELAIAIEDWSAMIASASSQIDALTPEQRWHFDIAGLGIADENTAKELLARCSKNPPPAVRNWQQVALRSMSVASAESRVRFTDEAAEDGFAFPRFLFDAVVNPSASFLYQTVDESSRQKIFEITSQATLVGLRGTCALVLAGGAPPPRNGRIDRSQIPLTHWSWLPKKLQ